MNALVTQDTPRLPTMQAGGAIRPIVPQDFEGAWRMANAVVKAGMAPKGLETPEKAMVAILHGLEVGLTPMAALQSIAVVNGRPTIWGDGALGLCRASSKCEYVQERLEGDGDSMVATCEVKRKGETKPIIGRFSVADAKKAALWGKQGPWTQYPKRMLAMRARAFALRDGFADVLRGLGIAEEVADIRLDGDITPVSTPRPPVPPVPPSAQISDQTVTEVVDMETGEVLDPRETVLETGEATDALVDEGEILTDTDYFTRLDDDMAVASDAASIEEVWTSADPMARFEGQPQSEINQGIANGIKNRHLKRIGAKS